jgi:hypothetical protein
MPKFESHQLVKQIPGLFVTEINFTSNTSSINPGYQSSGWEIVQEGSNIQVWVWRGYIDLSGWSVQELTNFVQSVDIQHSCATLTSPGLVNLYEYDFITSRKIPDSNCTPPQLSVPGFLPVLGAPGIADAIDQQQVIYGEWINNTKSLAETGTMVTVAADTFGGGSPIATDKLHITRIICLVGGADAETLNVFPVNYVINSITTEEKDLVWMERLRRSYVLQGEV